MITIGKAILALQPNAEFSYDNEDYSTLRWETPEISIPTEEAIQSKITELQADYDAKQYQRDRAADYPSWQEQMDLLYHGGVDALKAELKKTKDKFPKPE